MRRGFKRVLFNVCIFAFVACLALGGAAVSLAVESAQPVEFTQEELEYIRSAPTLSAYYDPGWMPIEFRDAETGEYAGIMAEIFDEISRLSGLNFEFFAAETFDETIADYNEKKGDILTALVSDSDWAARHDTTLTETVLVAPLVKIHSGRGATNEIMALPRGYYISERLSATQLNTRMKYYDSMEQCFEAVRSGEASYTATNVYTAWYYMRNPRYADFVSEYVPDINENIAVAVRSDADPRLLSIIQKSVLAITSDEMDSMILNNTMTERDFSLLDLLYGNPRLTILLIVSAALLVTLMAYAFARQRHALKQVKAQAEMIETITTSMGTGLSVSKLDDHWTYIYVNDQLPRLLGYDSREEYFLRCKGTAAGATYQDDLKRVASDCERCFAQGDSYRTEYRMIKKDGSLLWVLDTGKRYTGADGEPRINSVLTDITPMKEAMEQLRVSSETDSVTGIYNKQTFYEYTQTMINGRLENNCVLIRMDIDNFKMVNDMFGVSAGDKLLRDIAGMLRETVGGKGLYGHIEADNFVMCFPRDDLDCDRVIQRLSSGIMEYPLEFELVPRFGIFNIEDPSMPASLMCDRALLALRTLKGNYVTRVAVYGNEIRNKLVEEQQVINEMNAALQMGQFDVYLQPQINYAAGALVGAEALVRWRHPEKGIISPGKFIPIFERNGFIMKLDEYVWERVCKQLRSWIDRGVQPVPVSVNISRMDFYNPNLCSVLVELMKKYELPFSMLQLEITESAYVDNAAQLIGMVKQLQECGFIIEMDDFGSGYSSLNMLKNVPVDVLKLDMRFLSSRDETGRGGNILNSIVRMTKWLGLPLIAEGVETQTQADYLKSIGCDLMQGYLFAQPMAIPEFELLMLKHNSGQPFETSSIHGLVNPNDFWDPDSQIALIFNEFVGAAGVFEYNNGTIETLRVNDKYYDAVCMSRERYDGLRMRLLDSLYEPDKKKFMDMIQRAIDTNEETQSETRWIKHTQSGELFWLHIRVRLLANSGDRYIFYAAIDNITEEKELNESLNESNLQMKAVMENMSGGIAVLALTEEHARLLYGSTGYYELHDTTEKEYLHHIKNTLDTIVEEDREYVRDKLARSLGERERLAARFRIRTETGRVKIVQFSCSYVPYAGSSEPVVLAVLEDVT